MTESDAAALEGISRATSGLWQVLSQCVARIEVGLQAASPEASSAGQPGSRMLPNGAAQVRGEHHQEGLAVWDRMLS